MGCFWGAEELFWDIPGVINTQVGYMGGHDQSPTYESVCTGRTGHTETVAITYRPDQVCADELLKIFWESHDPTQGDRQGNDVGSQYRSAIYWTTDAQAEAAKETASTFADVLTRGGFPAITTELQPADQVGPFYPAEQYHQKYLQKNPNGYRCHARTGMHCPISTEPQTNT